MWYAAYGSNLSRERFMRYLLGGVARGARNPQRGARDATPPRAIVPIRIPHAMYFARTGTTWPGGTAFLEPRRDPRHTTYGRAYLISTEQFEDVFCQENDIVTWTCDLAGVSPRNPIAGCHTAYGYPIFLGSMRRRPIVTFTGRGGSARVYRPPSAVYLRYISRGLQEAHGMTLGQQVDYLLRIPGVRGLIGKSALRALLKA